MINRLRVIYKAFPIQLLMLHFKRNQFLLLCWLLLFLIINGGFAKSLGIPYLFLSPDYLDQVSVISFLLVGLTLGGLVVAYNIASYILVGRNFHFLGTLSKPFAKFSINNSIIPVIFLINYIIQLIQYQVNYELRSFGEALLMAAALPLGVLLSIFILQLYFWFTNKDFRNVLADRVERRIKKFTIGRIANIKQHKIDKHAKMEVSGYFNLALKWKKTDEISSDRFKGIVSGIFDQNHLNTVIAEAFIFVIILILGAFRDYPYFQIPAAASTLLFLTIILMFIGAVSYWFKSWSLIFSIGIFVLLNILATTDFLSKTHYAHGLDYDMPAVVYNDAQLDSLNTAAKIADDKAVGIEILENWRAKFDENPRMVILSVSGGGQRASYWTMHALQQLEIATNGALFKHTSLITGASGGLIGAAYFRELKALSQSKQVSDASDATYLDNIGKEALNPIIFSLLTNDIFIRYQKFSYNGFSYPKDRGYAFEQKLNSNLKGVLDKKLSDYKDMEMSADIPMLFLSPTSVNDGRKMYVSPINLSYMSQNNFLDAASNKNFSSRSFDFRRLFADQSADDLSFLTALRMSASFPYITPNINLPSEPPIEIMDAGLADNFGISDAILFLNTFGDWIAANTSGVTLLSIRDSKKESRVNEVKNLSITDKVFTPISNVYNNWSNIQDLRNDLLIQYARDWFKADLSYYTLTYDVTKEPNEMQNKAQLLERASLNWRLTEWEKYTIREAIQSEHNQEVITLLKEQLTAN
ncbi:MAG: hypothetical protein ACJAT1_000751 [Marivirga sp.]|jgi:hypothetical protein